MCSCIRWLQSRRINFILVACTLTGVAFGCSWRYHILSVLEWDCRQRQTDTWTQPVIMSLAMQSLYRCKQEYWSQSVAHALWINRQNWSILFMKFSSSVNNRIVIQTPLLHAPYMKLYNQIHAHTRIIKGNNNTSWFLPTWFKYTSSYLWCAFEIMTWTVCRSSSFVLDVQDILLLPFKNVRHQFKC